MLRNMLTSLESCSAVSLPSHLWLSRSFSLKQEAGISTATSMHTAGAAAALSPKLPTMRTRVGARNTNGFCRKAGRGCGSELGGIEVIQKKLFADQKVCSCILPSGALPAVWPTHSGRVVQVIEEPLNSTAVDLSLWQCQDQLFHTLDELDSSASRLTPIVHACIGKQRSDLAEEGRGCTLRPNR
jgi:hypothetical protein